MTNYKAQKSHYWLKNAGVDSISFDEPNQRDVGWGDDIHVPTHCLVVMAMAVEYTLPSDLSAQTFISLSGIRMGELGCLPFVRSNLSSPPPTFSLPLPLVSQFPHSLSHV